MIERCKYNSGKAKNEVASLLENQEGFLEEVSFPVHSRRHEKMRMEWMLLPGSSTTQALSGAYLG